MERNPLNALCRRFIMEATVIRIRAGAEFMMLVWSEDVAFWRQKDETSMKRSDA